MRERERERENLDEGSGRGQTSQVSPFHVETPTE